MLSQQPKYHLSWNLLEFIDQMGKHLMVFLWYLGTMASFWSGMLRVVTHLHSPTFKVLQFNLDQ